MTITYISALTRKEGLGLHDTFMTVADMTYSIALVSEGVQEVVTPKRRFGSMRELADAINTETGRGPGIGATGVAGPDFLSCHFSAGARDPLRKFLRGILPRDNVVQVAAQSPEWCKAVIDWANEQNHIALAAALTTGSTYVPRIQMQMLGATEGGFELVFPDFATLHDYATQQRSGTFDIQARAMQQVMSAHQPDLFATGGRAP